MTSERMPFNDAPFFVAYDRMKEVLDQIAIQRLTSEMDADHAEHADYEGAYNHIVALVREALA